MTRASSYPFGKWATYHSNGFVLWGAHRVRKGCAAETVTLLVRLNITSPRFIPTGMNKRKSEQPAKASGPRSAGTALRIERHEALGSHPLSPAAGFVSGQVIGLSRGQRYDPGVARRFRWKRAPRKSINRSGTLRALFRISPNNLRARFVAAKAEGLCRR